MSVSRDEDDGLAKWVSASLCGALVLAIGIAAPSLSDAATNVGLEKGDTVRDVASRIADVRSAAKHAVDKLPEAHVLRAQWFSQWFNPFNAFNQQWYKPWLSQWGSF